MDPVSRPGCTVVIRALNEEAHIGRLLSGIERQSRGDVDVVLVDSGSTDATASIAARWGATIVRIAPDEFSFGRALNRGIAAARGDLIVIASAHVYPVWQDWLERLLDPFARPEVALVYGQQRGGAGTRYSEHRVFARWFPETSQPDQAHDFCNNANAAIRRSWWKELPYDEQLTGLEDLDWARRVRARGGRVAYVAEARVIHVHDEPPARVFQRYRREALALRRIFPDERFGHLDLLRLLPASILSDWYHAARDGRFRSAFLDAPLFRAMQYLGTWRGFHERAAESDLRRRLYYPAGFDKAEARDRVGAPMVEYHSDAPGRREG